MLLLYNIYPTRILYTNVNEWKAFKRLTLTGLDI